MTGDEIVGNTCGEIGNDRHHINDILVSPIVLTWLSEESVENLNKTEIFQTS